MPVIETEIWKPSPDRRGAIIFDSLRVAQDIFNELETHLKADGRLPDEYFLLGMDWRDGALFPKDAEIFCEVNFGGSEGIYLDISVKYNKDVYERSQETGELGWINRPVIEQFATGKTLGETIDDLDKMNLAASSVTAAFYGGKREVQERYAKIESGEIAPVYLSAEQSAAEARKAIEIKSVITSKTIFGEVQAGDWVIAAGNSDYGYLLGVVTAIDKLGTPEHGTDNPGDDIHVDFTAFDYPPERIAEIEEHFGNLYGEHKTFGELPLDDVIMAPDELIWITHLGHDEITRLGNILANCESFCNCFLISEKPEGRHGELLKRLARNHEGYFASLSGFGKAELIEMADKISAMSATFNYLYYRGFNDDELDFLLRFENPLEAITEGCLIYRQDTYDEMGFAFDTVMQNKQDWLNRYPLVSDLIASADTNLRRYMDIDLELYLEKIAQKVIIHHPNDWSIDKKTLHRAARSDNPEDKRLMWHVCGFGTHLNTERDTFIKDTGAFNAWVNYRHQDEDMFGYIVEVTGYDGGIVKGNVFEVGDYYAHSLYVRDTANVLDSVSLTYSDAWGVNAGKTITVPRYEYNDDRHRLMSESGDITAIRYHPSESVRKMSELLRQERAKRMVLPIGSAGELLRRMADKLAEVRKPEPVTKPPSDKKPSLMGRLAEAETEAKAHNAQMAQNPINKTKNTKKEID